MFGIESSPFLAAIGKSIVTTPRFVEHHFSSVLWPPAGDYVANNLFIYSAFPRYSHLLAVM